jgi:hypothetical protein
MYAANLPNLELYHPVAIAQKRETDPKLSQGLINRVKKPGLAGRIPHDLRRTAVRNLERAGMRGRPLWRS